MFEHLESIFKWYLACGWHSKNLQKRWRGHQKWKSRIYVYVYICMQIWLNFELKGRWNWWSMFWSIWGAFGEHVWSILVSKIDQTSIKKWSWNQDAYKRAIKRLDPEKETVGKPVTNRWQTVDKPLWQGIWIQGGGFIFIKR